MSVEEKAKIERSPVMVNKDFVRMAKEIAAGEESSIQEIIEEELANSLPKRYRRFVARRADIGGES